MKRNLKRTSVFLFSIFIGNCGILSAMYSKNPNSINLFKSSQPKLKFTEKDFSKLKSSTKTTSQNIYEYEHLVTENSYEDEEEESVEESDEESAEESDEEDEKSPQEQQIKENQTKINKIERLRQLGKFSPTIPKITYNSIDMGSLKNIKNLEEKNHNTDELEEKTQSVTSSNQQAMLLAVRRLNLNVNKFFTKIRREMGKCENNGDFHLYKYIPEEKLNEFIRFLPFKYRKINVNNVNLTIKDIIYLMMYCLNSKKIKNDFIRKKEIEYAKFTLGKNGDIFLPFWESSQTLEISKRYFNNIENKDVIKGEAFELIFKNIKIMLYDYLIDIKVLPLPNDENNIQKFTYCVTNFDNKDQYKIFAWKMP